MLHFISWQQYITAVVLLTAAWYAYVGFKYHRPVQVAPMPTPMLAVMGSIQPDAGTESIDPDELIFSPGEPDDISEATLPKGPADDLLEEAITLASAFAESGTKADFLSLLQVLLDKYELYRDQISLPAIISALQAQQLPFQIQAGEWPQTL